MKYKSLNVKYMSGTGNSYRSSIWMREAAKEKGINFELEQITVHNGKMIASKKTEALLGLVFPTYGFTAPWLVIRYAFKLPWGRGQNAFVIATKGALMMDSVPFRGLEGSAAYLIAFILLLKGYRVHGVMGLDMPANMINVHSGLTVADSRIIIDQARDKEVLFINCILDEEKVFWGIPDLLLGLVLLPMSFIYMLCIRFFLAKLFFASDHCTGCGLCAKSCPKKAIIMVGRKKPRPYWKLTCECCMRCMGYCPNRAIESSHLFAVILIFLIAIPIPSHIYNSLSDILKLPINDSITKMVICYLCYIVTISFAYFLFFCLIKIPLLKKLFTYITLTHFYRRYHEPDTELKDIEEKYK